MTSQNLDLKNVFMAKLEQLYYGSYFKFYSINWTFPFFFSCFCLYHSGYVPEQTNGLGYTHKHTWTTERHRKQKGCRAILQAWLKPVKLPPHILLSWTAALHVLHVRYPSNRDWNAFVGKHSECQKEKVWTNWDINLSCSEKTKNLNASSLLWKVDRQIGAEVWTIKVSCQSKRECVSWGLGGRKETHSWCVVEKQHITRSR